MYLILGTLKPYLPSQSKSGQPQSTSKYLLVSFLQYTVIGTHLKPWNQEEQKKMSREKNRKCFFFFFLSLNLTSTVLLFWNKNKHLRPYLLQVNERFASSCSSKTSAISNVETFFPAFSYLTFSWQIFLWLSSQARRLRKTE